MQRVSPRRVSPTPPRNSPPNKATAPSGAFCSRTPSPAVTEATARCPAGAPKDRLLPARQRVSPRRGNPPPPRNSPPNKATAPSGAFCSRTPSPDVTEATARCPDAYLGLAGRLVDAARAVARRHFRQGLAIEDKADDSPVTRADREAETAMQIGRAHV